VLFLTLCYTSQTDANSLLPFFFFLLVKCADRHRLWRGAGINNIDTPALWSKRSLEIKQYEKIMLTQEQNICLNWYKNTRIYSVTFLFLFTFFIFNTLTILHHLNTQVFFNMPLFDFYWIFRTDLCDQS